MTRARLDPELERRLLACPTLPTLPAVALELLRLCHDDDLDLWKIARALESDPALSARVLRAANGISVAARSRVATLSRAVPLLGVNSVLSVALSFSLVRNRRRGERGGLDHGHFWRRAVFAALAGRALAEEAADGPDREEAFLGALLQDLGMLALAELFGGAYGPLLAATGDDHRALAAREREAWGTDHATVSALLMRMWRLPERYVEAVLASHAGPAPVAEGGSWPLPRCVASSGAVADLWVGRAPLDPERAVEATGLDGALLSRVLERMALAVPEASADFDIALDGPERVEEVLAEARALPAALGLAPANVVALGLEPADGPGARAAYGGALVSAVRAAHERARGGGEPLSLLLAAAEPLPATALAETLRTALRSTDLVGCETNAASAVLVVLPGADADAASAVAGRLLRHAAARGVAGLAIGGAAAPAGAPLLPLARLRAIAAGALESSRGRGAGVVLLASARGAA